VIETLCLLRGGRQIREHDLPAHVCARRHALAPAGETLTLALDEGLDAMTRRIVEATLALTGGDIREAAARLHISTRTIQRHIASGQVRAPV
jgi:DNA-binding NtrC family response regulator